MVLFYLTTSVSSTHVYFISMRREKTGAEVFSSSHFPSFSEWWSLKISFSRARCLCILDVRTPSPANDFCLTEMHTDCFSKRKSFLTGKSKWQTLQIKMLCWYRCENKAYPQTLGAQCSKTSTIIFLKTGLPPNHRTQQLLMAETIVLNIASTMRESIFFFFLFS